MDTLSDNQEPAPQIEAPSFSELGPTYSKPPSNKAPLREILEFLKRGSLWNARAKSDAGENEIPCTD